MTFPVERFCPLCSEPGPAPVPLATSGTVYSFTIARFAPPGYEGEVPYAVGLVELPDGIVITTTLVADPLDSLSVGAEVHFQLLEVDTTEGPALSFAYRTATT